MLLARIRCLLGIEGQDELIHELIDLTQSKILNYLKKHIELEEVPTELEFIIVELVIQRFNRIGSEGMESESMDGKSTSYVSDDFETYRKYLDDYISRNNKNKGYRLL